YPTPIRLRGLMGRYSLVPRQGGPASQKPYVLQWSVTTETTASLPPDPVNYGDHMRSRDPSGKDSIWDGVEAGISILSFYC
ncbi:MAG: hypothetical protein L3J32_08830, partial [Rhizobiaceae bacterium]|nr:hypothetical protein [Rhizobiaceae bacterium]